MPRNRQPIELLHALQDPDLRLMWTQQLDVDASELQQVLGPCALLDEPEDGAAPAGAASLH